MRYLVLCVDRDNDLGVKADVISPVVGRKENVEAAVSLAVADPEDSDINCIFGGVKVLDELASDGEEVEIATLCGDEKVGKVSDLRIAKELDAVIQDIQPDRIVLVTDGAEDEFILPIITSRIKVDRMVRVVVKQQATMEHYYYVLTRLAQDKKIQRKFILPAGVFILLWFLFTIIGSTLDTPGLGWMVIALAVGGYLTIIGLDLQEPLVTFGQDLKRGLEEGSVYTLTTIIMIVVLVVGMVVTALKAVRAYPAAPVDLAVTIVQSLYLWVIASALLFLTGKTLDDYWRKGVFHTSTIFGFFGLIGLGLMFYGSLIIYRFVMAELDNVTEGIITFLGGLSLVFAGYAAYRYVKRSRSRSYGKASWGR